MNNTIKKFSVISCLILFALISGLFLGKFMLHYNVLGQDLQSTEQVSNPLPIPIQEDIKPETPIAVEIPKIGIRAPVEPVGIDVGGKMGVPEGIDNIGWYSLGVKPGELGNAVIDGHLDTASGAPAIFYNLSLLGPGDLITVTDANNHKFIFRVVDKKTYEFNVFPLNEIFGESSVSRLNLITCEGYFDNRSHNYSHRTVVFSELVEKI